MAVKAQSASQDRHRTGRRREILGIVLLACGVFAGLSLAAMHAGNTQMMGPGGAATAAGLYALLGVAGYLLIVATLVVSWRSFRGQPLVDGLREGAGALMLLASITALLHLPFSGGVHLSRGPGGLLGQWLGEVTASFIGSIGAGLAATTLLFVALLLITEIQTKEIVVVVAWAVARVRGAVWMGLRALGRLAIAMFPERETEAALPALESADGEGYGDRHDARARARSFEAPVPAPQLGYDTDGIRIGQTRGRADDGDRDGEAGDDGHRDDRRAAISAIVAEVAAVERTSGQRSFPAGETDAGDGHEGVYEANAAAAGIGAGDDQDEAAEPFVISESRADDSAEEGAAEVTAGPGPIIVEPAWRTRMREREQARQDARDGVKDEADAAQGPGFIRLGNGAYRLPSTDLLEYLPPQGNETDKQGLYEMAERLEQAMANYGVRGKVKEIHMGPVVTMFEFAPEPGTRTGKIANLEKDLAMALEAQAVRILAPIPGKSVVGVEVPNKTREMVYLREILEDDCFTKATSKLQVALGKDIKGAPVSVNLSKMPHLLVAGTTGSGKSVAVNGMICSLLYNASPAEVRFIMVDPKMLELSIYEGIPHLLLPVVTDPKKANLALRWAVEEMERRYELLARAGVRDITSYNNKIGAEASASAPASAASAGGAASASGKKRLKVMIAGPDGSEQELQLDPDDAATSAAAALAPALGDGVVLDELDVDQVSGQAAASQAAREAASEGRKDPGAEPQKLPFIVIVIDEFADLMMVAPKDVETSVARIAQKARAAGLHLILATQRPSVDVITGLIKANFPSRIALQVASRIDSRTILDQPGADTLLGNGDMLFSDRGLKLRRLHGAFLSDDEVHRVVDHLKTQAKPVYDMDILKPRDEDGEEGGAAADDFHDDLYDQAVAIVCETRQASVSYIQRRLQIGYNRSARMVEQMERDGIVGPANGAKPREILAPPGEYLLQAG